MVWGQTRSLVLLLIINGVSCRDLFKVNCSDEICPCGESVTITYDLNDKLLNISVKYKDTSNDTFLQSDFFAKKKPDGKISIEWTDYKVMVTISEVTFSDKHKYVLGLYADSGFQTQYIEFNVSGVCEPNISEILETKELVCEVESESNSSLIWRNNHRYVYKMAKATKILTQGYKLTSTLKLTEEIEMEDNQLCCAASDGIHKEKEVCFPTTSAILSPLNSKNSTVSIVAIFVVVVLVAAAVGYLIKRRNGIMRAQRLSIASLLGQEVPQEENTPIPPLLQPQTV